MGFERYGKSAEGGTAGTRPMFLCARRCVGESSQSAISARHCLFLFRKRSKCCQVLSFYVDWYYGGAMYIDASKVTMADALIYDGAFLIYQGGGLWES